MLTIDNQPRQILPVTYRVVVWFHFEDVERVCPVKQVVCPRGRGRAVLVQKDYVRRKALLVHHPTFEVIGAVDVVVLMLSRKDALEVGLGHDSENSVRRLHQGRVEVLLERAALLAHPAVVLMVFVEFCVGFDCLDHRPPSCLPVVWDVQDALHEDLVVNKDSAAEILADVSLIVRMIILINSVYIAFLSPADR